MVASYYDEMEQGRLPASGVSDTVLEALGKIGWSSRDPLRRAGDTPAPALRATLSGHLLELLSELTQDAKDELT